MLHEMINEETVRSTCQYFSSSSSSCGLFLFLMDLIVYYIGRRDYQIRVWEKIVITAKARGRKR